MKKKKSLLIFLLVLLTCVGCTRINEIESTVLYLEQPVITTCSNNENYNLQVRFLCNDKDYRVSNQEVTTSVADISVDILKTNYIENDDGSLVIVYILDLIMPVGETTFDLNFIIDGKLYSIKDITHINYDNNFRFGGLEYVFNSIYLQEEGDSQVYTNNIIFDDFEVTDAEFDILGEEIESISKVGSKQVCIVSTNDKSSIVGYICIINGNTYCIGNSYHTELLNMNKMRKVMK